MLYLCLSFYTNKFPSPLRILRRRVCEHYVWHIKISAMMNGRNGKWNTIKPGETRSSQDTIECCMGFYSMSPHPHIDGLVQERRNPLLTQWSYVFLALTHRYELRSNKTGIRRSVLRKIHTTQWYILVVFSRSFPLNVDIRTEWMSCYWLFWLAAENTGRKTASRLPTN